MVAAWSGDAETAIERYRQAAEAGHLRTWLDRLEPAFAELRQDPRFERQLNELEAEREAMRRRVVDSGWYERALARLESAAEGDS